MARTLGFRGVFALLATAALVPVVEGHGRLTMPRARNGGDNGAVGGGPGSVHAFEGGAHSKYVHGICGNAAGATQSYNKVGEIQETYVAGGTVELKVVITAHHVGFFEFELCTDAGRLSESCFMEHRLLKQGCECSCPDDDTNSCAECESCRRWWKPLLQGELSQTVTAGYAGPELPGQGNLVPFEYTMRYVIPSGVKTSRGVLRWHYMTTNSCTSKSSAPEEFWNCADVAISDSSGDVGAELAFDNAALQSLPVEDLISAINSGELTGVNAACPEDSAGQLLGVGAASEYEALCGASTGGAYADCVDLSAGGGGSAVDCSSPPASGILCESECSDGWFQCHNGVAYTKYVPVGTKCKGDQFVLAAQCDGFVAPAPGTSPAPAIETTTLPVAATPEPSGAPTQAPTATPTTAPAPAPTQAPTATPTQAPAPAPPSSGEGCGSCTGCLWSSGQCYSDIDASYCGMWASNTWCGGGSLAQARPGQVKRHSNFLGVALIQGTLSMERSEEAGEASGEL